MGAKASNAAQEHYSDPSSWQLEITQGLGWTSGAVEGGTGLGALWQSFAPVLRVLEPGTESADRSMLQEPAELLRSWLALGTLHAMGSLPERVVNILLDACPDKHLSKQVLKVATLSSV